MTEPNLFNKALSMFTMCSIVLVAFITMQTACAAPMVGNGDAAIIYVDDDAPLGGDGRSWNRAFDNLQDALVAGREIDGPVEFRLAQGVYRPDRGGGMTAGDKLATFSIISGSVIRGGYGGLGSANPDLQDWAAHRTIVSGDLQGNDGPNFTNCNDNAYRIATAIDAVPGTTFEGMVFCSSQLNLTEAFHGGGIHCVRGTVEFRNCSFERNAAYYGAGIGAEGTHLVIEGCQFRDNRAGNGGGISLFPSPSGVSSTLVLHDSEFVNNDTQWMAGDGSAILAVVTFGEIRGCLFEGNHSDDGAISSDSPTGTNSSILVIDCFFRGNRSDYGAAAEGTGTYVRCHFDNNLAGVAGGAYSDVSSQPNRHARFVDCAFVNNTTYIQGGGACYGGQAFINCRFINNNAGIDNGLQYAPGGAIHARVPAVIANCEFIGNHAPGLGGAVAVNAGVPVTITNSTFLSNVSDIAGHAVSGPATICNSVFGQHVGEPLIGITSIDHSCLPLSPPIAGVGNIIADPRFVDSLGPDGIAGTEDDDLRLRSDSPCIDAGDTTALPADTFDIDGDGNVTEPLPLDLRRNARVLDTPFAPDSGVPSPVAPIPGSIVDMGAYEYRRPADVAPNIGDGLVNISDLIVVITHWGNCPEPLPSACDADTNADGVVNVHDLLAVLLNWG